MEKETKRPPQAHLATSLATRRGANDDDPDPAFAVPFRHRASCNKAKKKTNSASFAYATVHVFLLPRPHPWQHAAPRGSGGKRVPQTAKRATRTFLKIAQNPPPLPALSALIRQTLHADYDLLSNPDQLFKPRARPFKTAEFIFRAHEIDSKTHNQTTKPTSRLHRRKNNTSAHARLGR